jgi:hypothetical protein
MQLGCVVQQGWPGCPQASHSDAAPTAMQLMPALHAVPQHGCPAEPHAAQMPPTHHSSVSTHCSPGQQAWPVVPHAPDVAPPLLEPPLDASSKLPPPESSLDASPFDPPPELPDPPLDTPLLDPSFGFPLSEPSVQPGGPVVARPGAGQKTHRACTQRGLPKYGHEHPGAAGME